MVIASLILILTYTILFTEKINRAVIALFGACSMIFFGIITQEQAIQGIDFNTIALLLGMMIIVGIAEKSGIFQFTAVWAVKKVRANPRLLLMVLALITAILSALLDNVTTVLLIVPVTFEICKKLKIAPYPYLLIEIFASNIGGTATLIGDPPNILIGSALNLSFMDFVYELSPIVAITMIFLIIIFDFAYGRKIYTEKVNRQQVMVMDEYVCITDRKLLVKSVSVLFFTILGFIIAEKIHLANGTIAIFGASVMMLLYTLNDNHHERDKKIETSFHLVDWTTIFFFAGLFALVYGLEISGILEIMGEKFVAYSKNSIEKTAMIVLWLSAIISTAIDNIPFVATMIPMLKSMEESLGGREAMMPVWWALSLGACFGGNGSLIAASANVIVAGIAQKENNPISFIKFLIWSIPIMLFSVLLAMGYLHLMYFS